MIISKTPFRISFLGGGTDLPQYHKDKPGKVVGMAINKYCYILFRNGNNIMDYNFRIAYSKIELTKKVDQIEHRSVKYSAKFFKHTKSFDILHNGDLPAKSGLGSSSSFTVGMINIFRKINKLKITKKILAKNALKIEQDLSKEYVGCQDQVFAAYGGFNIINFKKNNYTVKKIDNQNTKKIINSMFLVFTGLTRLASKIEKNKIKNIKKKSSNLEKIYQRAVLGENMLKSSTFKVKEFGRLMDESWQEKKKLSKNVSNKTIDRIYNIAKKEGAYGGKLLGAGGGGFICFLANKKNHNKIFNKLKSYKIIKPGICEEGSKIIIDNNNRYLNY
jgi:D-glycero-alpha-D-manno-heptose-7-phosphate kinase